MKAFNMHLTNLTLIAIYHQCHSFNLTPDRQMLSSYRRHNGNVQKTSSSRTSVKFWSLLHASKRSGAMSRKTKGAGGGKSEKENFSTGFGNKSQPQPQTRKDKQIPSGVIYSRPALYDLAFGYRNYEEEVQFLLDAHDKYCKGEKNTRGEQMNILELAAGPARHSISALRNHPDSIASCTAVDISQEMIEYSNEVADEELGDPGYGGIRDRFHYVKGDMRSIATEIEPVSHDSVWILLGSMQHLTTNDDVISCFNSANRSLRQSGTLIIELPHPRETFTMVECTRNSWEIPLEDESGKEYGELKVIWGDDDDVFDPIRQVRDFTVAMDLTIDDESAASVDSSDLQSVKEVVPMRLFTYQEIDALGRLCGFKVEGLYGALSDEVDINNEDQAFRLVCVLKKDKSVM